MTKKKPFIPPAGEKKALEIAIEKLSKRKGEASIFDDIQIEVSTAEKKDEKNTDVKAPKDMSQFIEENLMLNIQDFLDKWEEMGFSIDDLMELLEKDPTLKSIKISEENKERIKKLLQAIVKMYKALEKYQEKYEGKYGKKEESVEADHGSIHNPLNDANAAMKEMKEKKQPKKELDIALEKLFMGKEPEEATALGNYLLEELLDTSQKVVDVGLEQEKQQQKGQER